MKKISFQIVLSHIVLIGMLSVTGCSSTLFSPRPHVTSTPRKLQLVNGKLDACLLITVSEIENVLTGSISTELFQLEDGTACHYVFSSTQSPALVIFVPPDAPVNVAGRQYTVAEWFEVEKQEHTIIATKLDLPTPEDIPGLADAAYYLDGNILRLYILKNGIEYIFSTYTPEAGGKGSLPALIALAEIALQRMP
jgi:hypothetical protein